MSDTSVCDTLAMRQRLHTNTNKNIMINNSTQSNRVVNLLLMYKLQIVSSLERLFVSHHGMPLEKTATIKLIHSVFDSIGMPLNYPLINSINTELECLFASWLS